jgi:hypothetical protein
LQHAIRSSGTRAANAGVKIENKSMKRFLILALQHQRRRIAALKRENERLQNLNQQRADDISFLMQQLLNERGSKSL